MIGLMILLHIHDVKQRTIQIINYDLFNNEQKYSYKRVDIDWQAIRFTSINHTISHVIAT